MQFRLVNICLELITIADLAIHQEGWVLCNLQNCMKSLLICFCTCILCVSTGEAFKGH